MVQLPHTVPSRIDPRLRDPRSDPQPGDVLRSTITPYSVLYVLDRCGETVVYQEVIGEMLTCTIEDWTANSARDQIIKRGPSHD
ncbi:hypothetical protein ISP17_11245 [Dyella ginsengisoli]|uniref:Uncharacterized protein n=1 Tax=Dyella ginsengisoli TaxID=363848 RepID=A0ABW8JWG5_9GAMM